MSSPLLLLLPLVLLACASARVEGSAPIGGVALYAEAALPHAMSFRGTVVGGISGIDRAPDGTWYLISDDRSASSPARFYTASLTLADGGVVVALTDVTTMRDRDGATYARGAIDPESIRFDGADDALWYTSEGDITRLVDPFVREMRRDGSFLREIPLPPMFAADTTRQHGARDNGVFEGMTLGADGRTLIVSTEDVLKQDGPAVGPHAGGDVRISFYDRSSGRLVRQVAYTPERAPEPRADTLETNNGVVEILARDSTHLLVLERGYTPGVGSVVRLFEADLFGATDIATIDALAGASYRPASKRLVADLSRLGLSTLDNVESMSWGPDLADGRRTLVLASDDNFSARQAQQLIVLAVSPP
jgi:hypothetical protein